MLDLDSNGDYLDGAKNIGCGCPADVPAKDFWSIVVYDPQTRSELQTSAALPQQEQPPRHLGGQPGRVDRPVLRPDQPRTAKKSNWTQTVPGKGWFTLLRLYGPLEPWFDKTWRPGEVEPLT